MSPVALLLLRRLAALAFLAAALLLTVPRMLTELGMLGPGPSEAVDAASRAVEAARQYGANGETPAFDAALAELETAHDLAARGRAREARRAAARATTSAVAAQRAALVERERSRREADQVIKEVDKRINDLEALYAAVVPGLDKATVSRLLLLMKNARQTGAALFVAFEEGDFKTVLQKQESTRATLTAARDTLRGLKGATAPPPAPAAQARR